MSTPPSPVHDGAGVVTQPRRDASAAPGNLTIAPAPAEAPHRDTTDSLQQNLLRRDFLQQESVAVSLPVETDIYILPDGRVVVADLPAELAARLPQLGQVEPCEITDDDYSNPAA